MDKIYPAAEPDKLYPTFYPFPYPDIIYSDKNLASRINPIGCGACIKHFFMLALILFVASVCVSINREN
jgi:hypothetical protein